MWSLIRTELTRLRWRRAILVLLAAMILIPAVLFVGEAWNTRAATDAEYAEAQAQYDQSIVWAKEELPGCLEAPDEWGITEDLSDKELASACEESMGYGGTVEDYLYRSQLVVERSSEDVGVGVITLLAVLGALIGTTFVGHDWASGSMSNQLLFETRRTRIWVAKAIAAVFGVLAVAAVSVVLFWTAIWVLAQIRDVETASNVWRSVAWTQARGLGVVAAATLAGYALTLWFRNTMGSLGLMFGVTVFSSVLIGAVLGAGSEKWMLPTNALAVIMDGYRYWGPSNVCDEYGNCEAELLLSGAHGATYLGVILALVVVASLISFRRRDVP